MDTTEVTSKHSILLLTDSSCASWRLPEVTSHLVPTSIIAQPYINLNILSSLIASLHFICHDINSVIRQSKYSWAMASWKFVDCPAQALLKIWSLIMHQHYLFIETDIHFQIWKNTRKILVAKHKKLCSNQKKKVFLSHIFRDYLDLQLCRILLTSKKNHHCLYKNSANQTFTLISCKVVYF